MRSLKKAKKETQTRKLANQAFARCHLSWIPFAQFFVREEELGSTTRERLEQKRGEKSK